MKAALQWLGEGKRIWWAGLAALLILCALWSAVGGAGGIGTGAVGTTASEEERRIAQVLSAIAGAGRVEVALFYETEVVTTFGGNAKTRPTGAVVVADGAGDMRVRLELTRAIRTLLGLPENAVDVFEMEETQ